MAVGKFIKTRRAALGLSLREAATQVGVDPAHLSRIETDRISPSEHLLTRLGEILGCSVDELALLAGRVPPAIRDVLDRHPNIAESWLNKLSELTNTETKVQDSGGMNVQEFKKGSLAKKPPHVNGTRNEFCSRMAESLLIRDIETKSPHERSNKKSKASVSLRYHKPPQCDPRNQLNALSATEWIPETVSVWIQRGLGADHPDARIERQHPAPFSFTDVSRLIRFFSKPGDIVLDPFMGVGSTLKAAALEGRKGIGIELNPKYVELSRERLQKEVHGLWTADFEQRIIEGDARLALKEIQDKSVDFVVTSPPYWNILHKEDHKARQVRKNFKLDTRYSDDQRDLGNIHEYPRFLRELSTILCECGRVLKPRKYMAVVVSDFRDKSKFIMFHADLANELADHHFGLRGIMVLYQKHKKIFPYGYPFAYVPNIHHQYILIFQNERPE